MAKYYLSEQKDMDLYAEGEALDDIQSEYLIIRVDRKGKQDKHHIVAPMCDYEEVSRTGIKAPKGYLKRASEYKKLSKNGVFNVWVF